MSQQILVGVSPTAVGIDIVSLSRIERALKRGLLNTVCHPSELDHGPLTVPDAARIWTGKEAIAKTLGTGFFQGGVDFPDVVVWPPGRVTLYRRALKAAPRAKFELYPSDLGDAVVMMALRYDH